MFKIQEEARAEWLAALRSGKYRQATGALKNADTKGYCCLGVACVVQGIPAVISKDDNYVFFEEEHELAPDSVVKRLGLYDRCGTFHSERLNALWNDIDEGKVDYNSLTEDAKKYLEMYKFNTLTELNDSCAYSFADIAEFIEANPDAVFR